MARIIKQLDGGTLDRARAEATEAREEAIAMGHTSASLRLETAEAWFLGKVPGWDGRRFAAWKGQSLNHWIRTLFYQRDETALDWLGGWLDLDRIRQDGVAWLRFWIAGTDAEHLPREWLRWAMREVQAVRKVTPGTPVDGQITTYLIDFDVFVTADKAFAGCIEAMRPSAPRPLARTSVSPGGQAAFPHLLRIIELEGERHQAP